jgi:hypothetical protein
MVANEVAEDDLPAFMDITLLSPIAAALEDVFARWARRARVFMTRRDMDRLLERGWAVGDIAAVWEALLYDHFGMDREQHSLGL